MVALSKTIFKAYDIRGVIDSTLDAGVARSIGQAFGQAALAKGERSVVIGRDGRLSGPELTAALAEGLQAAGVDVIDLGMVATPMVYFATNVLEGTRSGIMVTGSHNPPDYNGFKMVLASEAIHGEAITALYDSIQAHDGSSAAQPGSYSTHDIRAAYLERIIGDVKIARPIKIAVDCGNGVAGAFAGDLYRGMGCEVVELFCEVDGTFPNHHPDPAHPENLQDLIRALQDDRRRDRPRVRRRRRPPRHRHQGWPDHLSGPPDDAVRGRRVVAQSGRRDPVRRQVHAPPGAVYRTAWRPSADVQDRPLAGESQAARNRCAAGRRNERPHLLQGPLVRLRRRPVFGRAHARDAHQDSTTRRRC